MNGYNLIRNWYNYKFTNPSKVKASHSDMYCYLVDQWNRLGQKKEFGLPTIMTMECLGIGSYNTYKKVLNDLVDFGFVLIVKESVNQHQSKIIALSNFDKATIKAHDKALDTINKQINKETKNNKTIYRKFDHLTLYIEDFEKLNQDYSKQLIDDVLDSIENYKSNKNYKSLYLTAKNWLSREKKKIDEQKKADNNFLRVYT